MGSLVSGAYRGAMTSEKVGSCIHIVQTRRKAPHRAKQQKGEFLPITTAAL